MTTCNNCGAENAHHLVQGINCYPEYYGDCYTFCDDCLRDGCASAKAVNIKRGTDHEANYRTMVADCDEANRRDAEKKP